jgi:hypothetical protein
MRLYLERPGKSCLNPGAGLVLVAVQQQSVQNVQSDVQLASQHTSHFLEQDINIEYIARSSLYSIKLRLTQRCGSARFFMPIWIQIGFLFFAEREPDSILKIEFTCTHNMTAERLVKNFKAYKIKYI